MPLQSIFIFLAIEVIEKFLKNIHVGLILWGKFTRKSHVFHMACSEVSSMQWSAILPHTVAQIKMILIEILNNDYLLQRQSCILSNIL
jgi:hypothetical protein